MSPNFTTVLAAAESLPVSERRDLIHLLLVGLGDLGGAESVYETPHLTEAWRQEIARRSAEFDAGQAETVLWQEVRTRWQNRR